MLPQKNKLENLSLEEEEELINQLSLEALPDIKVKFQLSDEKIANLDFLLGRVAMGLLSPDNFFQEAIEFLGLDAEQAKEFKMELSSKLFRDVQYELSKLYAIENEQRDKKLDQQKTIKKAQKEKTLEQILGLGSKDIKEEDK